MVVVVVVVVVVVIRVLPSVLYDDGFFLNFICISGNYNFIVFSVLSRRRHLQSKLGGFRQTYSSCREQHEKKRTFLSSRLPSITRTNDNRRTRQTLKNVIFTCTLSSIRARKNRRIYYEAIRNLCKMLVLLKGYT